MNPAYQPADNPAWDRLWHCSHVRDYYWHMWRTTKALPWLWLRNGEYCR